MKKTNLFKSMNIIRCVSGASLNLFRNAAMVLVLLLGVSDAWANSYYSRFTAKSGDSAKGLVYAAGSNSDGAIGDYTNQFQPSADDGSSGEEYTWYAWAKAARGYQFETWTNGSNINSSGTLTNAATTFGVKHSTSDGAYVDGDATATFESATAYTLTFKRPENFGGYTAEYANYTISNNKFVEYTKTITMTSASSDTPETSYASDKVTLTATARTGNFLGWYVNGSQVETKTEYTFYPSATCTIEGRWEEVQTNIPMTFKAVEQDENSNYKGYYTVSSQTVQATDYNTTTGSNYYFEATLTAYPADGYVFTGWYTKEGKKKTFVSYENPYNAYFDQETTLYANFTYNNYTDEQKAQFKVGSQYFLDLNAANTAAGSNGTIVCTRDGVLPPGNYTISGGVKLYIPYSTSESYQTTPAVVTKAEILSAYRTLTFAEGANVTVEKNGVICVGGKIMSAGGGNKSAYVTGPCGVINMANGGHIELNNGAKLYCWGFLKGQDMDQGNNTLDVGSVTANEGATIYQDFEVGDWRGGTATSNIYNNSSRRVFPFQSYSIQNIEVPTTFKYGSTLNTYVVVNGGGGDNPASFDIIGSKNTLFLLKDAQSVVRMWYDPTTDLTCYELSGTAQLDALSIKVYISMSSSDYNLPISNSMHIILTNCNMTLSKPMTMQAGSVIEIKEDATANLESNLYMFDKDDWGLYIHNYYFRSFNNLTSHKNRGAEDSNAGLEDAKLIVDGTLNITGGKGYLYSTTGGANVMGNGGGKVVFGGALASSGTLYQVTVNASSPYINWVTNAINTANLCNEDGSYTKSIASTTFHNVNGRWFTASAKEEKADHTYDFTYISAGQPVSGTSGTPTTTDAVYSNDKTGLEARMKWANVTADACENWWQGQGEQATWFYNYSLNSAWHQFIPMASPDGWFSGSDNNLYEKSGCTWNSVGEVDENCLYTIGGVKKALVNGNLIQLEKNTEDEAFHNTAATTEYYICFEGCNWHPATKLANEEKAYKVEADTFIWYNDAWMAVEYEKPFFYTLDETNVKVYYEYVGGEWVEATPAVKVKDNIETRYFYFIADAFTVANGKKNTTITLLKDIPTITTALTYSAKNTTCTLDLNGHVLPGSVTSMLKIDASGSTFTITDNSENKDGRIQLTVNENARRYGVNLANGNLILNAGTIKAVNTKAYNSSSAASTQICALYAQVGTTFTMNGGSIIAEAAYNPFGIYVVRNASTNTTVTINNGTVHAESTQISAPYAVYGNGTVDMNNGLVEAVSMTSDAHGIYSIADAGGFAGKVTLTGGEVKAYTTTSTAYGIRLGANASGNAKATLTMSGGTVTATAKTTTAMGIYVGRDLTYDTNEPRNITKYHFPEATISNGTVRANTQTNTGSEAIRSYGTLTISGGNFIAISGGDFGAFTPSQSYAYGLRLWGGEAQISGTPTFTIKATTYAYGITSGDNTPAAAGGAIYNNTTVMDGGTFNVTTTTGAYAYGVFVSAKSRAVTTTHASNSSYYAGNYANAGNVTINNGTFNVTAATSNVYGIYLEPAVSQSGASGYTTATAAPVCTVNNGTITATAQTSVSHGAYISAGARLTVIDGTLKGKLTKVAADGWATGTQVLGGGTLVATGGTFIGESANSSLSAKQKSYAAGILASTHSTNGGSNVSVSNATLRGELKSTYLTNGGSAEWVGGAYGLYSKTVNDLTLTNCTLQAVSAYQGGFGIRLINTPAEIHDCTATINTTYAYNYGIFTEGTADAKVYNSSFTDISGTTWAYGAYVYGGALTAENCEFHSTTQQSTATSTADCNLYGIKVNTGMSLTLKGCVVTATGNASYSQNGYGLYVDGSADVTNSEITVSSVKKNAYAVFNTANTTLINLHSGKFKASAGSGTVLACNGTAAAAKQVITGGYYSHNTNLSNYAAAPYHVFTLPTTDAEYPNGYRYEVAEAYTLAWVTDGNDLTGDYTKGTVKVGATLVAPNTPTKTGYTFSSWGNDYSGVMPAVNTTYTAQWTINSHNLTWNANGGELSGDYTSGSVNYGTTIVAPTAIRENYVFNGWGAEVATAMPDNDLSYTAQWTPAEASVTVGSATTYYTSIAAAFTAANSATSASTIKVLKDATVASGGVTYNGSQNCTLDLNGHTISYSGEGKRLLIIDNDSTTFTITDQTKDKLGTLSLTTSNPTTTAAFCVYVTKGTLHFEAGKAYLKSTSTTANAVAVRVDNSNFIMNGGTAQIEVTQSGRSAYAMQSIGTAEITVNDGNAIAKADKGNAYGTYVTGTMTINGGKFHITGQTPSVAYTAATSDNYKKLLIKGGYYNTNAGLATYVAPGKSGWNYYAFATTAAEKAEIGNDYDYKVAEAYTVTFNNYDGTQLQSCYVEKGKTPSYSGTPTRPQTDEWVYTFEGWTPALASVMGTATYTATFTQTKRKYHVTWTGVDIVDRTDEVAYGETPDYGELPTKEPTVSEVYTYKWMNMSDASIGVKPVTGNATYEGSFTGSPRPYTITFVNDNGGVMQSSEVGYGNTPEYDGKPVSAYNAECAFIGWSPEITLVGGDATYTATYRCTVDPIVVVAGKADTVTVNTATTTTTVHVSGTLTVEEDVTLATDDLILEATPSSSGEISGKGNVKATNAYFHLSREGGFQPRTWYAVAVPWQVDVPAYDKANNGVYIKTVDGNFVQQALGSTYDLIYYNGELRATGASKAWNYVEEDDAAEHVMVPGRAYMIYLTSYADTIRFKKKADADLYTNTVSVTEYKSNVGGNYANWNGIANPATYKAYLNVGAVEDKGQVYNPDTKGYEWFEMTNPLQVGQPIFVQPAAATTVMANSTAYNPSQAPRRVKEDRLFSRYELMLAASDQNVSDRIIVRMDEDKEADEYIVGEDLAKMGVSSIVAQMWVARYDTKMSINTVAPLNNTAEYPLGIYAPKSGEYDLFIDVQPDSETMLYLTYDGEAVWNLSYGGYVLNLSKGTDTHYGLRIVYSAPKVPTSIEETTIQNGDAVRKVLIDDKVFIIRNGGMYSIDGQMVK